MTNCVLISDQNISSFTAVYAVPVKKGYENAGEEIPSANGQIFSFKFFPRLIF